MNTINSTNALQTAVYALIAIIENHPLTDAEFDQLEQAWQGVNTMLAYAGNTELAFNMRIDVETTFAQGVPLKKETTDLALHRAFVAMTLNFCTPLHATAGLVEYINDAANDLKEWAVL